jgi:hypothetical protein
MARLELCRIIEGCAGWAGALSQHRRGTVGEHINFVGLDVHKETIAVCVAEAVEIARFGSREIPNEPTALDKLVARLGRGVVGPCALLMRPLPVVMVLIATES